MTFRPTGDIILITPDEPATKTPGGILIPDRAKGKPKRGVVAAAGPGRITDSGVRCAMDVAVGDRVLFSEHSASEIELDGEDYLVMRAGEVVGIL
ncbi:Heat shock protein 60 family co-chaperone GroES [Fimbriiglobus ruber]|uniref:Co-chaperonin GroES n=1 Tax=Fimbriiglobus ruber TaxID=1908690 RepID=A0A225CYK9_9BACT|nr:co-chaperone GroES [Fimbriiglobus ruber]OWK34322.1 Heat shock protein 60 family co-chaperone GroES [Fimbriiglobus ruber]